MTHVSGGTFLMGSTPEEVDRAFEWCGTQSRACQKALYEREAPARQVTVTRFWMSTLEVSAPQFAEWLNSQTSLKIQDGWVVSSKGRRWARVGASNAVLERRGNLFSAPDDYGDRPMVHVTWEGAAAYCSDHGFRLPTEAEWEWAARGEARRTFPWGNGEPVCGSAVFGRTGEGRCGMMPPGPVAIGESTPDRSATGLLHMAGNVSEWVVDAFVAPYPACASPCTDPRVDGPAEAPHGVRGGAWNSLPEALRGATRSMLEAGETSGSVGFRCAASLTGAGG